MSISQPPRRSFDEVMAGLTELGPTPEELAALSTADKICALARSVSGLGAERAQLELWLDVVCPERTAFPGLRTYQNPNDWRTMYSCGLTCRSHLRRLGIRHPRLGLDREGSHVPYRSGDAVSSVVEVAMSQDAWVTANELPPPGAMVVIGSGVQTHILTVVAPIGEDLVCESVDGGQIVGTDGAVQLQGILTCRRPVRRSAGKLSIGDRGVVGFLHPDKICPSTDATFDLVLADTLLSLVAAVVVVRYRHAGVLDPDPDDMRRLRLAGLIMEPFANFNRPEPLLERRLEREKGSAFEALCLADFCSVRADHRIPQKPRACGAWIDVFHRLRIHEKLALLGRLLGSRQSRRLLCQHNRSDGRRVVLEQPFGDLCRGLVAEEPHAAVPDRVDR